MREPDQILMAHGGGGELTQRLVERHILPRLGNPLLAPLADGALLGPVAGRLCLTTDSFVVQPLVFPGGDIGHLAVCGTVNDLAMMGARPLALSLALILEEGLPLALLDRVLDSIAAAAAAAGVPVATGDTKVIERGGAGGLLINTTGLGELRADAALGPERVKAGDLLLVSGGIAEHGLAVLSVRRHLEFATDLVSDAAALDGLAAALLAACGEELKFMRDPTRGGVAGLVCDLAAAAGLGIELDEAAVPILPAALATAELLGLDPLGIANEGKLVAVVSAAAAPRALAALRAHPLGGRAAVIGRCLDSSPPLAELITRGGGRRLIARPYGDDLPRIC